MIWTMLLWGCSSHHAVVDAPVEAPAQRSSVPSVPGVEDWSDGEYRQQLLAIADAAGKKSREAAK